jgi:hypothetical protein
MTILLRTDGSAERIKPSGEYWSLEEMQTLVGGYVEVVRTHTGHWLIIDEEGKLKNKQPNVIATMLYQWGGRDCIAGDALLVDNMPEFNGPDELTEEEKNG